MQLDPDIGNMHFCVQNSIHLNALYNINHGFNITLLDIKVQATQTWSGAGGGSRIQYWPITKKCIHQSNQIIGNLTKSLIQYTSGGFRGGGGSPSVPLGAS